MPSPIAFQIAATSYSLQLVALEPYSKDRNRSIEHFINRLDILRKELEKKPRSQVHPLAKCVGRR